jgi:hypothetical protein
MMVVVVVMVVVAGGVIDGTNSRLTFKESFTIYIKKSNKLCLFFFSLFP